jgi:hypothetical protein
MEHLPIYIKIVFSLTTFLTILLLFRAANYSRPLVVTLLSWLILQAVISLTSFYTVTDVMPPRFALLLLPPLAAVLCILFTKKGREFMDGTDVRTLTLLHVVRIPVELILYSLYIYKVIPEIMTFEGRNFDILCGLTAPFIYYFGYIKNILNKKILLAWNILCLLLLANIVVTAALSAPFPIQRFAFGQPNIALLYFPFIWLPSVIVPAALFAHVVSIRRLIKSPAESGQLSNK